MLVKELKEGYLEHKMVVLLMQMLMVVITL